MHRRTLLRSGSLAILGLGVGGCASLRSGRTPRPRLHLPPVHASWDRVIRTTVGLRPHRASGFRLQAERLDGKTVIHNYGHGGAGVSLAWGTGQIAAELALEGGERRAAVIGCGAVGLCAARQLQRRGFTVTIYAERVPPGTTSNMSLAGFTPTSGLVAGDTTPEWDAQFLRAATISYRQLQLLAGRHYGVSWIDSYSLREEVRPDEREGGGMLPDDLRTGQVVFRPGGHPFPARYAIQRSSIRIEPSIYLNALVRDVQTFGGRIVIRRFDTIRDLMSLPEPIVINCSGLGARELVGDEELIPVKGQLTVLVPQPEITYRVSGGGNLTIRPAPGPPEQRGGASDSQTAPLDPFGRLRVDPERRRGVDSARDSQRARGRRGVGMNPRSDGIVLSGTSERGVWSLEPNEEARQQIVEAAIRLFGAMQPPPGAEPPRFAAAPRVVPRLEAFFGEES